MHYISIYWTHCQPQCFLLLRHAFVPTSKMILTTGKTGWSILWLIRCRDSSLGWFLIRLRSVNDSWNGCGQWMLHHHSSPLQQCFVSHRFGIVRLNGIPIHNWHHPIITIVVRIVVGSAIPSIGELQSCSFRGDSVSPPWTTQGNILPRDRTVQYLFDRTSVDRRNPIVCVCVCVVEWTMKGMRLFQLQRPKLQLQQLYIPIWLNSTYETRSQDA